MATNVKENKAGEYIVTYFWAAVIGGCAIALVLSSILPIVAKVFRQIYSSEAPVYLTEGIFMCFVFFAMGDFVGKRSSC